MHKDFARLNRWLGPVCCHSNHSIRLSERRSYCCLHYVAAGVVCGYDTRCVEHVYDAAMTERDELCGRGCVLAKSSTFLYNNIKEPQNRESVVLRCEASGDADEMGGLPSGVNVE